MTYSLLDLPQEILGQILRYLLRNGEHIGGSSFLPCDPTKHWDNTVEECTCSLIELSSQVLQTNNNIYRLGHSILYNENVLRVRSMPGYHSEIKYIETMDFDIGGIIVPIMSNPWHVRDLGFFAEDIYEVISGGSAFSQSSDVITHPKSRFYTNFTYLSHIRMLHLELTYSRPHEIYAVFRSLRNSIYCKDLVIAPIFQPDYSEVLGPEAFRDVSLEACQIARCRSVRFKEDPFEPQEEQRLPTAQGRLRSMLVRGLVIVMTSSEPAHDLWREWDRTHSSVMHDVPRSFQEVGSRDSLRLSPTLWKSIWQGDRTTFLYEQHNAVVRFQDVLAEWFRLTNKHIDSRIAELAALCDNESD